MSFYTKDELKELTGTKQKTKICEVLKDWNIPFKINALGWPVVHRSAFLSQMQTEQEPDFSRVAKN
jgi:hypothetical protein